MNDAPSNAGRLTVIGLGPGDPAMQTAQANEALAGATDIIGYAPYLARLKVQPGVIYHPSDNRVELERARHALHLTAAGRQVAVVSSGDAGVFAMASAIYEAIDHGAPSWRTLDVRVVPGISALLAVAARIGAPLGADFCVISLSDNLKPWDIVEQRLTAAASAGFVLALYNPASSARTWQFARCLALLQNLLPGTVPVIFATAVSRPDEHVSITTLAEADPARADMRTLVLIGTTASRLIARPNAPPWVYTPRRVVVA